MNPSSIKHRSKSTAPQCGEELTLLYKEIIKYSNYSVGNFAVPLDPHSILSLIDHQSINQRPSYNTSENQMNNDVENKWHNNHSLEYNVN